MKDFSRASSGRPRILMRNRQNALSSPGGDTVVMMRIAEELTRKNVHVDVDVEHSRGLEDYDLVHLHNFATPEHTEMLARECVDAGVPYVVTTMYEDAPLFYTQMSAQAQGFFAYINAGQPAERFEEFMAPVRTCAPAARLDNRWTADHAAALIASGPGEQHCLMRDYPNTRHVATYRLGSDVGFPDVSGERFAARTGMREFVLCVARLESRKNQLMLLKALEDSELPLVLATGGFTYQRTYAQACQIYRRRGKTLFLNRLEPQDLASAYVAARVHVLPSWYELPGIVSQEAAKRGIRVVVTDNGTPRDYFGDFAQYCKPDDYRTVRDAVLAAMDSAPDRGLTECMADCTWENAAGQVLEIYRRVLYES